MSSTDQIRVPKPIKSINNNWIEDGYFAWEYLPGKETDGRYEEKIELCDLFSGLFESFPKPGFVETRTDPWTMADKVVWGEIEKQYDDEFQKYFDAVKKRLKPIVLLSQIIHEDIEGNILFDKNLAPAVIDITIYWRPKDFAKALLALDILAWENENAPVYKLLAHVPEVDQLLLRAGLKRILEKPEQIKAFGWNKTELLSKADRYIKSLESLGLVN